MGQIIILKRKSGIIIGLLLVLIGAGLLISGLSFQII